MFDRDEIATAVGSLETAGSKLLCDVRAHLGNNVSVATDSSANIGSRMLAGAELGVETVAAAAIAYGLSRFRISRFSNVERDASILIDETTQTITAARQAIAGDKSPAVSAAGESRSLVQTILDARPTNPAPPAVPAVPEGGPEHLSPAKKSLQAAVADSARVRRQIQSRIFQIEHRVDNGHYHYSSAFPVNDRYLVGAYHGVAGAKPKTEFRAYDFRRRTLELRLLDSDPIKDIALYEARDPFFRFEPFGRFKGEAARRDLMGAVGFHDGKLQIRPGTYASLREVDFDSSYEAPPQLCHWIFAKAEHGMSGGPILNSDLKFVGMVRGGDPQPAVYNGREMKLDMTMGATADDIATFVNSYVDRA